MKNSQPEDRSSLERSREKSGDSKRGIFTSYSKEPRPHANPYLGGESSLNFSKGNLSMENSQQPIFHQKGDRKSTAHFNQQAKQSKGTIPYPNARFRYSASAQQSPIKYVPIDAQRHQIVHDNVERTYIPQHIYNHIMVPNSLISSISAPQSSSQPQIHSDEAYNLLLGEYDKLYMKFNEIVSHSSTLQRDLERLRNRKQTHEDESPQQARSRKLKHKLNIQALHDGLLRYYQPQIEEIIQQRKHNCESRIAKLFESAYQQLETTVISDESSIV